MSRKVDYESKTETLITPILESRGFELWDIEYVKEGADYYLRAYIDKEGGITIDDCVEVSRELSDELDREDFIDEAYILEISSPGLGRTLKKERDFDRSLGHSVDIKTYKPVNGSKEFTGELKSFDRSEIVIRTESGDEMTFDRSDVAKVNLSIDF